MTSPYLTNITPDSFSGLLFGLEGIRNTIVLMNGPTGCKFYHSATSDNQAPRQMEFDPLNYPELWYFGQPRIPCTYLDKRDYVYGSKEKLVEALRFLKANLPFDLLAIVNSPGAALIGDDLRKIADAEADGRPILTIETPGYSHHIWDGYSALTARLIDAFSAAPPAAEAAVSASGTAKFTAKTLAAVSQAAKSSSGNPAPSGNPALPGSPALSKKKVNLLGLSIFHKYYQGDLLELERLLRLCGAEPGCALCCNCSLDEIGRLHEASLNLVVDSAYGMAAAKALKERFGTPYIVCDGLPIGFRQTEELAAQICGALGTDPAPLITESEKSRARSYIYLSRLNSLSGLPKGAKFAVHGTASQCLGYARCLIQYFGMVADSINVLDSAESGSPAFQQLQRLLEAAGMASALEKDVLRTDAELVFADGNIIAQLKARHHSFSGVEISLPSLGYTDVVPKTHLGLSGGLLLCEQVINGLRF